MNVLVACEFSGIVRDAFLARGHTAMSCDLLPTESHGPHYRGNVLDMLDSAWDLMIAHPPCTHLAVSGARWLKDKREEQVEALAFVRLLLDAPIPRICLENPVSVISTAIRRPDQIIQPWQFGHGEIKKTCLWLKNLPLLKPSNIVDGREARVHREPPGRIGGRTAVAPIRESPTQWPSSGDKRDAPGLGRLRGRAGNATSDEPVTPSARGRRAILYPTCAAS